MRYIVCKTVDTTDWPWPYQVIDTMTGAAVTTAMKYTAYPTEALAQQQANMLNEGYERYQEDDLHERRA